MTGDDDRRATTRGDEDRGRPGSREQAGDGPPSGTANRGAAGPGPGGDRQAGRVPDPEPEEAPELLGERSDYPIVWDGED